MINFSVIIPNYNHAPFLKQRIDSVLEQAYSNFEVIIIDDASTDNSLEIIESYKGNNKIPHIIYNEKNSGSPFKPWSQGIALAKYSWIWIGESDDFADPMFLKEAADAIMKYPSIGIFYCDCYTVDDKSIAARERYSERKNKIFNTKKWSESYYKNGVEELNECLKFDSTINNVSSVVFKKHLLVTQIEMLNKFYLYGDLFFFLNASFSTNIYYCNKPLNYYRIHPGSHLHLNTSIITSRSEYFRILKVLYYNKMVTDKTHLLDHFAYNYLSFGIIEDGLRKGLTIIRFYFKHSPLLAWKITIRIIYIKLFRIKRAFRKPVNNIV